MGFIRKYTGEIIFSFFIVSLFLFLRLLFLQNLPIFTDEAIYMRWAQIALQDANWRFISLTDGKQPLFIWLTVLMMKFVEDPLLAGRLVSVFAGFITMIGLWVVSYELFKNKRIAFLASLAYVCFPFAQVVDRMALYDSVSGAFTVWALYLSVILVKKVRLDVAFILGFVCGFGIMNKSTNFFSIYLLPFTLLLFDWSSKFVKKRFIFWCLNVLVVIIIAEAMYAVLRLSPFFHIIGQKNTLFIYSFAEWREHPFTAFFGNLTGMTNWLYEYLKLPFVMLILGSFVIPKFVKEKLLLVLYFLLPFVALALFARILFPRFIFFMTLSLLPLVGYTLDYLMVKGNEKLHLHKNSLLRNVVIVVIPVLFFAYPLYVSLQFAIDPVHSAIALPDRYQYTSHWTSGWGVKESIAYLKSQARDKKIFIGTEGTFGLMPFALELYLVDKPNITIRGYWPLSRELPKEVVEMSKKMDTFIVFYQPNNINPPEPSHLLLIQKTKAGDSPYYYRVYKVVGF